MSAIHWIHCLEQDEGQSMTGAEVVQAAIDRVKLKGRRERLQAKFDEDPDGVVLKLSKVLKQSNDAEVRKVGSAVSAGAIDPANLEKWIELILKFLPLILALL